MSWAIGTVFFLVMYKHLKSFTFLKDIVSLRLEFFL